MQTAIRILLIEDYPGDVKLINAMLRHKTSQFLLTHAPSLTEGLALMRSGDVDVVLLDLGLAESMGLDTLRRANPSAHQFPIIVLSGLDDEDTAEIAVREGAQDYLIKGKVDTELLCRSIRYAIERKRSQLSFEASQTKFRQLHETMRDAFVAFDMKDRIIEFNSAYMDMLGYEPEELCSLTYLDLTPKKWHALEETIQREQVLARGYSDVYEKEYWKKDGTLFPVELRAFLIKDELGNPVSRWAIVRDITERKQTEIALRESQERLMLALRSTNMGVWRWEISEDRRYFDDQVCSLLGIDPSSFKGTSEEFFEVVHPDDRERIRAALNQTVSQNVPYEVEYRVIRPDRSVHYVNARGSLFHDDRGLPVRINGTLWDVTDRKKADEALYEQNVWIKAILESSPAAIYAMNTESFVLTWNRGAERIFGWSREEVVGKFIPIIPESQMDEFYANRMKILRGEPFFDVELLRQKKDGSLVYVSMHSSPIYGADGSVTGNISIAIDLTHQKKMEKDRAALENQLRQAQKMEAIGQLAGGVAHDFNNILSAIIGYSQLMLLTMGDDDPNRLNLNQIMAASERATVLTQSLLAFSRKQPVNLSRIDLGDVVANFEKLLLRIIQESIDLKTILIGHALPIMADRGQIEQVLMNLVTNARDSIQNGGRIIIETGQVTLDQSFIEAHGFGRAGGYALLSVTDTGIGMTEDIKNKIFDPFFTTKDEGKGTGLGLSIVYGIVKKHDGYIDVYSRPGIGTTFKIYLPLLHSLVETPEQTENEEVPLKGGDETILLAEDNTSVRTLTATVLRHFGYTVIEATDGLDALAKFAENKKTIRLVVLDGIMPKMNGKEAWQAIKALSPGIRTVFMSGYAEDIFTTNCIPGSGSGFVQKPSTPTVLIRKIREVLDG